MVITVDQLDLQPELTEKIKREIGEKIGDLCKRTYGQLYALGFSDEDVSNIQFALSESNLQLWPAPRG